MSGDLAAFLLARIAEDEAWAHASDAEEWGNPYTVLEDRFSSVRVLAECEAKRRIVRLHFRTAYLPGDDPDDGCVICGGWPCDTLRALAAPYAGHPDFDPAWRL